MKSIADFAASAAHGVACIYGKKSKNKNPVPKADTATISPVGDRFRSGFASMTVMPENITAHKYYVAGYKINNVATGVHDPLTVRAMWLDCGGNEGIVLVSADVVGLTGHDVRIIRSRLSGFCERTGCKLISISCTHTHAGIDTVGYWGPLPFSGRDENYMEQLFESICTVVEKAYKNAKSGRLYEGYAHVPQTIVDTRMPIVVNDKLTRIRFVPDDGSAETWFLNYSAHPNTLGRGQKEISADYPYFLREAINREKQVNVLFAVGSIAATNIANLSEDRMERCRLGGEELAKAALEIDNDVELENTIKFIRQEYLSPVDNNVLILMPMVKVCTSDVASCTDSDTGIALLTEMTYLKIGSMNILVYPGELFCEVVYGGYSSIDESATGLGPGINPDPLCKICGDDNLVVFGVSNDMTGYVVPPNDFLLHPTQPYLSKARDRFDRNHYHETNSLGAKTAPVIAKVFEEMVNSI